MQDIDADPYQEVSDGGQHEELLKDKVVKTKQDGLKHG